jgi:hypothetical protein
MKLMSWLFIAMIAFIAACNTGDPKTNITRKWKIDPKAVEEAVQKQIEKLKKENPGMATMMEGLLKMGASKMANITMEFKADGTMASSLMGKNVQGKWEISADGKTLIQEMAGAKKSMKIVSLSSSKLILKDADDDKSPELTLIPN